MAFRQRVGHRRRGVGVFLLGVASAGLVSSCASAPDLNDPWFGGFAYLTTAPEFDFDDQHLGGGGMVLSFVVADDEDSCMPSWTDADSLESVSREFKLEQQIAGLLHEDEEVALSFGGASGDELATVCGDVGRLRDAYSEVLRRYQVDTADFDVEMDDLGNADANARRAEAVADLQKDRGPDDPLRVWLTLPVSPDGLAADAADVVVQTLEGGVDLTGVNLMTMSFGGGKDPNQSMAEAAESAARATHGQLKGFYREAGVKLTDEEVWNRIGLTPMIGQNDVPSEVFDQDAARQLNQFARQQGVGRMSFWALNRDRPCPPDQRGRTEALLSCSGVDQETGEFARILGEGFDR